jgi:hypothetical protein
MISNLNSSLFSLLLDPLSPTAQKSRKNKIGDVAQFFDRKEGTVASCQGHVWGKIILMMNLVSIY